MQLKSAAYLTGIAGVEEHRKCALWGPTLNRLCVVTVQTRGGDDVHRRMVREREGQKWLRSESDSRSPKEGERC